MSRSPPPSQTCAAPGSCPWKQFLRSDPASTGASTGLAGRAADILRPHHRSDEPVATACHGRDVTMAILAVPQCASQRRNLDFEVASFDKGIRPYEVPQFILADQSTGPLDQCDQDVERS